MPRERANATRLSSRDWFTHDRFGMFIHWGLYALPARHEWVKNYEQITDVDYQQYFDHFNPDLYDPREWARAAKTAGMKYAVITTKHHEGFCLFDSKHTQYKSTRTPWGKDLIKPFVQACRAEGIRVGFYYSLIDWHHPEFPIDRLHPMRENAEARAANSERDIRKYAKYLHAQVRELLTNYGEIDYVFFDFSYPGDDGKGRDDWQSEKLLKMVRSLQPNIIVNDRLDLMDTPGGWDVRTPEQFMVRDCVMHENKPVLWETCQTFSGSWGYHRDETTWKSVDQLLLLLINTVSKGGNLLLNVGPTARGAFDQRAMERLNGMGRWMRANSRAIYGCGQPPAEFPTPENCLLTYNKSERILYVHVLVWPIGEIHLDGFAGKVKYAQFLHDGSEVRRAHHAPHESGYGGADRKTLTLVLPIRKPDVAVPVIELFLR